MVYPYYSYGFFDFNTVFQQWSSIGLFDIVLPIVLIFTVVFAIMQRTRILGGRREIDAIVSLVIGFFAIANPEVSRFFAVIFQQTALGIVILLVFLLLVGLINARIPHAWDTITLIGGIAVFFWVMSRAADYFGWSGIIFSSQWWTYNSWWIVPAIMFLILMLIVVGSGEGKPKTVAEKFKDILSAPSFQEYYNK